MLLHPLGSVLVTIVVGEIVFFVMIRVLVQRPIVVAQEGEVEDFGLELPQEVYLVTYSAREISNYYSLTILMLNMLVQTYCYVVVIDLFV